MKILVLTMSMLLGAVANGRAEEPSRTGLTIRVSDLVASRGEVVIALFDSPEAFEKRSGALCSVVLPVDGETREWRLDGLAPGEYAAVVYQDLNGNRTLDRGKLGIPKEPYGFSNAARAAFSPPSYDKARFTYDGESGTIEVRLKRRSAREKRSDRGSVTQSGRPSAHSAILYRRRRLRSTSRK